MIMIMINHDHELIMIMSMYHMSSIQRAQVEKNSEIASFM